MMPYTFGRCWPFSSKEDWNRVIGRVEFEMYTCNDYGIHFIFYLFILRHVAKKALHNKNAARSLVFLPSLFEISYRWSKVLGAKYNCGQVRSDFQFDIRRTADCIVNGFILQVWAYYEFCANRIIAMRCHFFCYVAITQINRNWIFKFFLFLKR